MKLLSWLSYLDETEYLLGNTHHLLSQFLGSLSKTVTTIEITSSRWGGVLSKGGKRVSKRKALCTAPEPDPAGEEEGIGMEGLVEIF